MNKLLIAAFCLSSFGTFSQDAKVHLELSKADLQLPSTYEVPGKGLVVVYDSYSKSKKPATMHTSVVFYDKELEKKWSVDKCNAITLDKKKMNDTKITFLLAKWPKTGMMAPDRFIEEHFLVSRDAKYGFETNFLGHGAIARIDLETGEQESITISPKGKLPENTKRFIDDKYLYAIKLFEKGSKGTQKTTVHRIDIESLEQTDIELTLPNVGRSRQDAMPREWEFIGAGTKGYYFKDSYASKDKATKAFFSRVICMSQDGKKAIDKYVFLGDKIADSDHLGDLFFNQFGEEKLYVYSIFRAESNNWLSYSCFDADLEPVWNKAFDSPMRTGAIQRTIWSASIEKRSSGEIVFYSGYGLDEYQMVFDPAKNKHELIINESKECDHPFKYAIECEDYNKIVESGSKNASFMKNDARKTKDHTYVNVYHFEDRFLIGKVPKVWMGMPDPIVDLYMLKK